MPIKWARRQEESAGTMKSQKEIHKVKVRERGAQAAPTSGLTPSVVPEE